MKLSGLQTLGAVVRPFTIEAFAEFLGDEPAKALYAKATRALARVPHVKPDTLRMLVSLRPDLMLCVQFVIVGPIPRNPLHPFGCLTLIYPDTDISTRQHGSADTWSRPPLALPPALWAFLDEAST